MPIKKLIKKTGDFINNASNTFKQLQKRAIALKERIHEQEEVIKKIEEPPVSKHDGISERVMVELSVHSVVKSAVAVMGILILAYFLYLIKSILIIFFVSLFLASVFNPGVDFFQRHKVPRWLGLIIIYFLVFALLIFLVGSLVPIIIEQLKEIANNLSGYINTLFNDENATLPFADKWQPLVGDIWSAVDREQIISSLQTALENLGSKLGDWTGNALGAVISISAGIMNMVMVMFITFFIVIDRKNLHTFFLSLFPSKYGAYLSKKNHIIQENIGDWISGQLLLSVVMGLITFIVFSILGIKYAATLAIISGISEFIPYIGPIITFASAGLIAINQSTGTFLWLVVAYVIIQAFEGNILVPLIMSKSVGINPIIIILAMLIGWQFLGVLGMIIAIPLAKIISIFIEDYRDKVK